jgi:hypothetical protein
MSAASLLLMALCGAATGGGGGGPPTYTTWNPSDKGSAVTLTNGNLKVTSSSWSGARSTVGKSSGKWYWEYTPAGTNGNIILGVATPTASVSFYLGSDAGGYGYYNANPPKTMRNAAQVAYGTDFTYGTVIGVALDMDAGTVTFYNNGVSQGVAFSGLTGTIHAAASVSSAGIEVLANFGATAFSYTPPAGFNAGLY